MKDTIKYLKSLIKHKWYVALACFKMKLYWRGIKHDWTKFSPAEFPFYVKRFGKGINQGRDSTGYYDPTKDDDFKKAWCHHKNFNSHHWQYWVIARDWDGGSYNEILEMPLDDIIEMLCDWWGANKAYGGDGNIKEYFERNSYKMQIHPKTLNTLGTFVYIMNIKLNEDWTMQ